MEHSQENVISSFLELIDAEAQVAWEKYYDDYSKAHPGFHPNVYEKESFVDGFIAGYNNLLDKI